LPASPLRRRPRGLLWFWTLGLALAALIYWTLHEIPALTDLLGPFYLLIAIVLAILTFRWFRPRAANRRRHERRGTDRRDESPPPG
jgi:membrane protein implicated in regulation of membrane protease activity